MAVDCSDESGEEIELSDGEGGSGGGGGGGGGGGILPLWVWIVIGSVLLGIGAVSILVTSLAWPSQFTCISENEGYYKEFIEKPSFEKISPPIVCSNYGPIQVNVSGSNFIHYNWKDFSVFLNDERVPLKVSWDCEAVDIRGQDVLSCDSFSFDIPQEFTNESHAPFVEVRLPKPDVDSEEVCNFVSNISLLITPAPTIFDLNPPAVCRGRDHVFILDARYLLLVNGTQPLIEVTDPDHLFYIDPNATNETAPILWTAIDSQYITDGCVDLTVQNLDVSNCTTITVNISPEDIAHYQDLNILEVTNPGPADCQGKEGPHNQFRVVEQPVITSIYPPVTCAVQSDINAVMHGTGFLVMDSQIPRVTLNDSDILVTFTGDCQTLSVTRHTLQTCNTMDIIIPQNNISEPWLPPMDTYLPIIEQCTDDHDTGLLLVPPPEITDMWPRAICINEPETIVLHGIYFFTFNGTPPNIFVEHAPININGDFVGSFSGKRNSLSKRQNGTLSSAETTSTEMPSLFQFPLVDIVASHCTHQTVQGATAQNCSVLTINLWGNQTSDWLGLNRLTLINPSPIGCDSVEPVDILFWVVDPPKINSVYPPATCIESPQNVTIHGERFLVLRGQIPRVTLDGINVTVHSPLNCTMLLSSPDHPDLTMCTALLIEVPSHFAQSQPYRPEIAVYNPRIDQCYDTNSLEFMILPPALISDMLPPAVCLNESDTSTFNITLFGRHFLVVLGSFPQVTVGVAPAIVHDADDCTTLLTSPSLLSCNELIVELPNDIVSFVPNVTSNVTISLLHPPMFGLQQCSPALFDFTLFPSPSFQDASPRAICSPFNTNVSIQGEYFAICDSVKPSIFLSGVGYLPSNLVFPMNCIPTYVTGTSTAEVCTEIILSLNASYSSFPITDITLSNPPPLHCSTRSLQIAPVVEPELFSVSPPAICVEQQPRTLNLTGQNFLFLRGVAPHVEFFDLSDSSLNVSLGSSCSVIIPIPEVSLCSSLSVEIPMLLPTSEIRYPNFSITDPSLEKCTIQEPDLLGLFPSPFLEGIDSTDELLCSGIQSFVTLHGYNFFTFDSNPPIVTINGSYGSHVFFPGNILPGGCSSLGNFSGKIIQNCTSLQVSLDLGLSSGWGGFNDFLIESPSPIGCSSVGTSRATMFFMDPFQLTKVHPPLVCTDTNPSNVTLYGNFLKWDDNGVQVFLGGSLGTLFDQRNCTPLGVPLNHLAVCTELLIEIPQGFTPIPNDLLITVNHSQVLGCSATSTGVLLQVPQPQIFGSDLPVLCNVDQQQELTFDGQYLFHIDGNEPTLVFNHSFLNSVLSSRTLNCTDLSLPGTAAFECQKISVLVSITQQSAGQTILSSVIVTNPDPPGCTNAGSAYAIQLAFMDPPFVSSAVPRVICAAEETQVELRGSFHRYNVSLDAVVTLPDGTDVIGTLTECTTTGLIQTCNKLSFLLPLGYLGDIPLNVSTECSVSNVSNVLFGVDPPDITNLLPYDVCEAVVTPLEIFGTNFLEIFGSPPFVEIDGFHFGVNSTNNALPFALGGNITIFPSLNVTFRPYDLAPGFPNLTLTNLYPSDCKDSASNLVAIVPVPEIHDVQPSRYCFDQGANFTVTGLDFVPRLLHPFTLGGAFLESPAKGRFDIPSLTFANSTTLTFELPAYYIPPGVYNLTVYNMPGCEDTFSFNATVGSTHVHPTVLPFFVDPPTVYNGIFTQVTVYTSGLLNKVWEVILRGPDSETIYYNRGNTSHPPFEFNKIRLTIPSGTKPGMWSCTVISEIGCFGIANNVLFVSNNTGMNISEIQPPFGYVGERTAVTIRLLPSSPVPFKPVPRVYLTPSNATGEVLAVLLGAVTLSNTLALTAVIPPGQQIGWYDLIIVNPDATIGVLQNAFLVVPTPLPRIDSVIPGAILPGGNQNLTIYGENFDAPQLSLSFYCLIFSSKTPCTHNDIPIASSSNTSVSLTTPNLDCTGLDPDRCILHLTNIQDGTFASFPISIVDPSSKPPADASWASQSLQLGRKGAGFVGVSVTQSEQYLLVIGGDNSTSGDPNFSPIEFVEFAGVDLDGVLTPFRFQEYTLPTPVTATGATVIRDYVYLLGGHDGIGPTNQVFRSLVQDPLNTPRISLDIASHPGNSTHIPGIWSYRVSAYFNETYDPNPNGETLPGESLVLQLPDLTDVYLELELNWELVPGAAGYNLYRTQTVNSDGQDIGLLQQFPGENNVTFYDTAVGTQSVDTLSRPLPVGSMGKWAWVANMSTPRWAHTVFSAPSQSSPSIVYLYAAGGAVDGATVSSTVEMIEISINPPLGPLYQETHTLSPAVIVDTMPNGPRMWFSGKIFDVVDANYLQNLTKTAFSCGRPTLAGGPIGNIMDSADIQPDGTFSLSTDDSPARSMEGYCFFSAGGLARLQGGYEDAGKQYGSGGAMKGKLQSSNSLDDVFTSGWAASGSDGKLPVNMAYMSCLQFNAFAWSVGGVDYSGSPTILSELTYAPT